MNEPLPRVTICVLTYGNHAALVRRCIESIRANCPRPRYRLVVGSNAVGQETSDYLAALEQAGAIDKRCDSETNLNKCPMMRRMLAEVETEYVWWFDDDSHLVEPNTLERWLERAEGASSDTVLWGHLFFFGHERDFNCGTDVVGFVKGSAWYCGRPPPSWELGGKGEFNFEGRDSGDGRWFFITGGCWLARMSALRELDWPDVNLVKRNDDVFLCEAIRQQGWAMQDIGCPGVKINDAARRGDGEDMETMNRQMSRTKFQTGKPPGGSSEAGGKVISKSSGCVFLPTFRDTELLKENFANRPELPGQMDFFVYDDNFDEAESEQVRVLCRENGWKYRHTGRLRHGDIVEEQSDLSPWNEFVWTALTELANDYEYVVKVDTDAYLVTPDWYHEFESILAGRCGYAGTPEYRPTKDVAAFFDCARKAGYSPKPGDHVMHVQGGIAGYSKAALSELKKMGFLKGRHVFLAEDCYLSYALQILEVPFFQTASIGSWWHPYRPKIDLLRNCRAIHPMRKSEWEAKPESNVTGRQFLTRSA